MEQENAQAKLAQGLKVERGDLDALIMEFEQLVCYDYVGRTLCQWL
jgi:hypothetical protein